MFFQGEPATGPFAVGKGPPRCPYPNAPVQKKEVLEKLLYLKEVGVTRYADKIDIGGQPFADVARQLEFFTSQVATHLRKEA
jgi:hypothetical protein